jgi:hypothetical protein
MEKALPPSHKVHKDSPRKQKLVSLVLLHVQMTLPLSREQGRGVTLKFMLKQWGSLCFE